MSSEAANKQQIGRACNLCRLSHTACESTRPCRRCVAIGKAHLCADVEMRKRGRPRKSGSDRHNSTKAARHGGSSQHETSPTPSFATTHHNPTTEPSFSSSSSSSSREEMLERGESIAGEVVRKARPTSEWQSAAAVPNKRPRLDASEGFKIRMPSLANFDPFDPFQVSTAAAPPASSSSSSMVSVSRTASTLNSHSERISNISSSFFGLAESSSSLLSTSAPREAFSSSSSSSFSYSLHGTAAAASAANHQSMPGSATSSASASALAAAAMSLDLSSSSSSFSSSLPSSPYSSPPSSPSSLDSSGRSLLASISSSLLGGGGGSSGGGGLSAGAGGGGGSSGADNRKREDVLEGILSLVLEELREVKQHNREMRKQLDKVVKRQTKTEQQLLQIKSPPPPPLSSSSSTSASTSSSSSSSAASASSSGSKEQWGAESTSSLTSSTLSDILNRMPFLLDYSVSPEAFVVSDARKPFYAIRVISQYIGEDSSPPIFIFVNNVYAELSGYALNELLGRNINKVTVVDEQAKKEMLSKLFQSAPQTISEPFALPVIMRRKDGRVLRCDCRHQAFYNELGYIRWCVTVIESYTELDMRGEDLPLDWAPPITWPHSGAKQPTAPTAGAHFTSSPATSSPASSSTTPLSDHPFASPPPRPSAVPSASNPPTYPAYTPLEVKAIFDSFQQQQNPPVHQHGAEQQRHSNAAHISPSTHSVSAYLSSSSSASLHQHGTPTTSAPSPLFSGSDDRIDLQELLLQLIPPSPSLPSYGAPSTPSSSSASSSAPAESSIGAQQLHQTGSGGGEYSWLLKEPGHQQQAPAREQNGWYSHGDSA